MRRREALFDELRTELAAHAAAEERYLYAPILMDDMGLAPSRHALAEHHDIDECVEAMSSLDTDGDAWLEHARKLSEEVHHHLREEEKKFFQVSGKILSDAEKQRLAAIPPGLRAHAPQAVRGVIGERVACASRFMTQPAAHRPKVAVTVTADP